MLCCSPCRNGTKEELGKLEPLKGRDEVLRASSSIEKLATPQVGRRAGLEAREEKSTPLESVWSCSHETESHHGRLQMSTGGEAIRRGSVADLESLHGELKQAEVRINALIAQRDKEANSRRALEKQLERMSGPRGIPAGVDREVQVDIGKRGQEVESNLRSAALDGWLMACWQELMDDGHEGEKDSSAREATREPLSTVSSSGWDCVGSPGQKNVEVGSNNAERGASLPDQKEISVTAEGRAEEEHCNDSTITSIEGTESSSMFLDYRALTWSGSEKDLDATPSHCTRVSQKGTEARSPGEGNACLARESEREVSCAPFEFTHMDLSRLGEGDRDGNMLAPTEADREGSSMGAKDASTGMTPGDPSDRHRKQVADKAVAFPDGGSGLSDWQEGPEQPDVGSKAAQIEADKREAQKRVELEHKLKEREKQLVKMMKVHKDMKAKVDSGGSAGDVLEELARKKEQAQESKRAAEKLREENKKLRRRILEEKENQAP